VLTSAGSAAGLDLCLHLVRRDFGAEIANAVARRLVVPPHREGGQAQFVERPMATRERNTLSSVIDSMHQHLAGNLPIAQLARQASMSERTFLRRFKEATGTTPADWLTTARLDLARHLLESTSLSMDSVAEQSGLGTAMTLRHHFRRKLGTSPSAYKERFATSPHAETGASD